MKDQHDQKYYVYRIYLYLLLEILAMGQISCKSELYLEIAVVCQSFDQNKASYDGGDDICGEVVVPSAVEESNRAFANHLICDHNRTALLTLPNTINLISIKVKYNYPIRL